VGLLDDKQQGKAPDLDGNAANRYLDSILRDFIRNRQLNRIAAKTNGINTDFAAKSHMLQKSSIWLMSRSG